MISAESNQLHHSMLTQLANNISRDLKKTRYPEKPWVRNRTASTGAPILNVLIIGGGQSGLAAAFGLMRERVDNILIIEKAERGCEGPWRDFARMPTLRTPKYLSGMDFGIANLTFESWYAARYDQQQYDALNFIPTHAWAEYLDWFRETLEIPVRNSTSVESINWNAAEQCYDVSSSNMSLLARKVVLATGIEGCGDWIVPSEIRHALPSRRYAHTREVIDFASLKGKKVGVLGAGASAFDNAILAAQSGASEVSILCRKEKLPSTNPYRWSEFVGFLNHHADLSDDEKWKFSHKLLQMGQLPPKATFESAMSQKNLSLHTGINCTQFRDTPIGIEIHSDTKTFLFDFLIIGTGAKTDLHLRPELSSLSPDIALWKDRYQPPEELINTDLLEHPYLGANYEFLPKDANVTSPVNGIFCYNFGSLPSLGLSGGSISGMKYSLRRLVQGITKQLYLDDVHYYFESLENFNLKEFELL